MPKRNTGPKLKWLEKRKCFYAVWYDGGRECLHSFGTADGREAEAAFADWLSDRLKGERRSAGDPHKVTIGQVLDLYGTEHAPSVAAPERIGYAIAALSPFWAGRTVASVTKKMCADYAKERGKAPATVRRELTTLRAALNFAGSEKLIDKGDVPTIMLPDKPAGRERWLTRSEAARLLNEARKARSRSYLPLFIMLGLYTGARKTAILSLRWHQVDLTAGRIDFRTPGERRTNKRKARIPIPRSLLLALRRAEGPPLGYVVNDGGKPILDIGDSNNGSFGRACRKAGLEKVSPHTLRHTCGTWMAQRGVDLWEIGGWLGQSHATTVELYAHHHPDFMDSAKAAMERGGNRK